jgi:cation:H+ antiporter
LEIALLIAGGLVLLVAGGEAVVRGSVAAARRLGVSELVIGLTLVGFGTSTPEMITSVNAALAGAPGIAVGNVVGSNIANILLILALTAAVRPIPTDPAALRRDGTAMMAASVALVAVALALDGVPRWTGVLFLLALGGYIWWAFRSESGGGPAAELDAASAVSREPAHAVPLWRAILLALAGIGLLMVGADLLVRGAVDLARGLGVSETVIGLTIVAVGTSLPEMVASLAAALRGRPEIAFGNVLGSNIYNVLGILGVTAVVSPLPMPPDMDWFDWGALLGASILMLVHSGSGARVSRPEGLSMLAVYAAYVWAVVALG